MDSVEDEKQHPNSLNADKFLNRLENIIQVTRESEELSYVEVMGCLEKVKLDLYLETARDEIIDQVRDELGL